jgi:ATP-binding cassette subfamily B protein
VRVHELLTTAPRIGEVATPVSLPDEALAVELDAVTFAYDGDDVLHDVSFAVQPGRVLGVVGRTGSGKTTIARLVCRLYDAADGVVRVGGQDVRGVRLDELRHRIALVTQDVHLFAGTLRDNVRLFDPDIDDVLITDVFHTLGLRSWLEELPDGLDTELGPTARGLSAGEAQLVALARAFLGQPGVVVLDEASSRLDPHTEELLEHAVDRLLAGRTGIVIAHRLRTIERVDDVLVLERGRVVEHGPRASLAADRTSRFAALLRTGLADSEEVPA